MSRREDQRQKLLSHLREVLAEQKCVEGEDLDVEALVLLAKGRLDALPVRERKDLLRRIARDPEAADLLRELVRIGPSPSWYGGMLRRASGVMCVVAGVVTVALGAWRLADPPTGWYPAEAAGGDGGAAVAWVSQDQMRSRVMFASAVVWLGAYLVGRWAEGGEQRPAAGGGRRLILARRREPAEQLASGGR